MEAYSLRISGPPHLASILARPGPPRLLEVGATDVVQLIAVFAARDGLVLVEREGDAVRVVDCAARAERERERESAM